MDGFTPPSNNLPKKFDPTGDKEVTFLTILLPTLRDEVKAGSTKAVLQAAEDQGVDSRELYRVAEKLHRPEMGRMPLYAEVKPDRRQPRLDSEQRLLQTQPPEVGGPESVEPNSSMPSPTMKSSMPS